MTVEQTIFALSSGAGPAAIGVIRVSGADARQALIALAGILPEPRRVSLRTLRDANGAVLDKALVLWLPGPNTPTGEDCAEFHCHGGRAVLRSVEQALGALAGLRPAEPGEFTRRAFATGRIDLAQAEGLADLLSAETELQRAAALAYVEGSVSARFEHWREVVLQVSAKVEAVLDFGDEDDVGGEEQGLSSTARTVLSELEGELREWLARPYAEKLGQGFRIVLAGPPNSGKSTLFNALVQAEAAITSPIAGTTRDVIERSVGMSGIPMTFVDTAGIRPIGSDAVEAIGIERAQAQFAQADLVLWLGPEGEGPAGAWEIAAREDAADFVAKRGSLFTVSAQTGARMEELRAALLETARAAMPKPGEAALNARQREHVGEVARALAAAAELADPLLLAEELRRARLALDRLIGRATTEDMLDALFGRFCIGK
jgi:tRNA modification GTPase